jgi:hypothetical protein
VVYIYAVHLSGGQQHEHITEVRWKNPDSGQSGTTTRTDMVRWVENGGVAYVCGGHHLARVRVVRGTPSYLRTVADDVWTNNLLALPRF